MTGEPDTWSVDVTRPARRALADRLPSDVAFAAGELLTGALTRNPYRVGKLLNPPFTGDRAARVMREWRVIYRIDEQSHRVVVRSIRHRRDVYKP